MDEEPASATHAVGGSRVQVVAIGHSLESVHVAESVSSFGEWSHRHLALAGRIVAAASALTTAAVSSVDVGT